MNAKQLLAVAGWLAALAYAATSHAETVVFEADTITAAPRACQAGDPLCASEYVCREDGNGRTCETREGWLERQAASRCNAVGPEGWHECQEHPNLEWWL